MLQKLINFNMVVVSILLRRDCSQQVADLCILLELCVEDVWLSGLI